MIPPASHQSPRDILGESTFAFILVSSSQAEHLLWMQEDQLRAQLWARPPSWRQGYHQLPYTGNAVLFRRPCEPVHYSHFSNSFLYWFST